MDSLIITNYNEKRQADSIRILKYLICIVLKMEESYQQKISQLLYQTEQGNNLQEF